MGTEPTDSPERSSSGATDRGVQLSRRQLLAAQSLALAGAATGAASAEDHEREAGDVVRNTVSVDTAEVTAESVSDQLFGRLCEHYSAGTIYPGVCSQHVKNPSFYPRTWSPDDFFDSKAFFDPATIERHEGVPFPWEPVDESGVSFEQRPGGVAAVETTNYQRVTVDDARGGVSQKLALPDFRTRGYDLAFSVRGEGVDAVTATVRALHEPSDNQFEVGEVVATAEVDVTGEWERHEVGLELAEAGGDRFFAGVLNVDTPYGIYVLEFAAEGSGHVDLDWITLGADDAVNGKFNPSTVELMREKNTTWLKWPGGNFTSQYNWRDGIGPLEGRPTRFNHAWGGLEPNYFGTDEYLELCELADLTPRITVGWWDDPPDWASERQILPEDAADWVAYCNDPPSTEMGRLRKENGRPRPWNVTNWEVGNEVWGPWQRGHTADPSEYASGSDERQGFNDFYDAMTAVDDSITVYADGMSPGLQEPGLPTWPDEWNGTLFEESGDRLDGFDLHHYSWGIEDGEPRQQWYDENTSGTPEPGYWDYSEVLIMFPTQFGVLMDELAAEAADAGLDDFDVNVGEWGLFPSVDGPYPGPETVPGGSYFAGMLNAFVRQSAHVREACNTWVPVRMFTPEYVFAPPDPNPMAPAGTVYALYSKLFEGNAEWHAVGVGVDGASRTIPETGYRIRRMEDVPYVDAAAMRNRRGKELAVFLTNRNLREASEVTLDAGQEYADRSVAITRLRATASDRPLPHFFQTSWEEPTSYEVVQSVETVGDDGTLEIELGPASVARLLVDNDHGRADVVDDDGVWDGTDRDDSHPGKGNGRGNGRGRGEAKGRTAERGPNEEPGSRGRSRGS